MDEFIGPDGRVKLKQLCLIPRLKGTVTTAASTPTHTNRTHATTGVHTASQTQWSQS
jgi:hypothetical protein